MLTRRTLILAVAALAAIPGLGFLFLRSGTIMPGLKTPRLGISNSDFERDLEHHLRRHVELIAGDIGERHVGRISALNQAADYIESEFRSYGYEPQRESFIADSEEVSNIYAEIEGTNQEVVIIGAHYDTVPGSPGANDNTSGIAAMLELARLHRHEKSRPTIRFIAFVNEEQPYFLTPMMGSQVHAERSSQKKEEIICMFSLETIGYYTNVPNSQRYPFPFSMFYPSEGNFIGFVANLKSRPELNRAITAFRSKARINSEGLAAPRAIADINRSDQVSFWRIGAPAIMITDTANYRYSQYHLPTDTPEVVHYPELAKVVVGLTAVVHEFMT